MKRCPFCAEEIQDAAIKCKHCGSMMPGAPGAQAGTAVATAAPRAAALGAPPPTADNALVASAQGGASARDTTAAMIFEGVPSWKGDFWRYVGAGAVGVLGVALIILLPLLFALKFLLALIIGGVVLVGGAVWMLVLNIIRKSNRLRITTRTLDMEKGIVSKTIDTLQLWKVRDIEFQQSLLDRILGVARIRIFTHDVTSPELNLRGLPGSREIFDKLKNSVELARQARNVIGVVE